MSSKFNDVCHSANDYPFVKSRQPYWMLFGLLTTNRVSMVRRCIWLTIYAPLKMYKFIHLLIFFLMFSGCAVSCVENEVDDYIKTVSTYYQKRHANVLTHFSCFSKSKWNLCESKRTNQLRERRVINHLIKHILIIKNT